MFVRIPEYDQSALLRLIDRFLHERSYRQTENESRREEYDAAQRLYDELLRR